MVKEGLPFVLVPAVAALVAWSVAAVDPCRPLGVIAGLWRFSFVIRIEMSRINRVLWFPQPMAV